MSWKEAVALAAETRLAAAGIRLTLGGEPTVVPFRPEGAEWSISADGPTKLLLARQLARDLQLEVWPGSTLLYCPGKRYEGEVNPRWALRLITGSDGAPAVHWPEPCQPGLQGRPLLADEALAWLQRLGERLGVRLDPVPLRDPLDPDLRIWAAPLTVWESDPPEAPESVRWRAEPWPLEPERRELSQAPGPAGLRLPLQHFPADVPRQVLTLEVNPGGWELFLPPLLREPLEALLQAVADSLKNLAAPRLSGMLPTDFDGQWQVMGLTADPGVLEINLPVCRGWAEYDGWLRQIEHSGQRLELRSW
ncbi:MAG TPA: transglutaminase family protein, partial [Cyanobium sp.]|nr:transglutaminase family protein [Cyanobium sp.]